MDKQDGTTRRAPWKKMPPMPETDTQVEPHEFKVTTRLEMCAGNVVVMLEDVRRANSVLHSLQNLLLEHVFRINGKSPDDIVDPGLDNCATDQTADPHIDPDHGELGALDAWLSVLQSEIKRLDTELHVMHIEIKRLEVV